MSVEYETEVWQKSSFPMHSVTTIGTAWPTQLPEVTEQFKELEEEARRRPIGGNFSTKVCVGHLLTRSHQRQDSYKSENLSPRL